MSSDTERPASRAASAGAVARVADVVVLGASFAGIEVVRQLQRRQRAPLEIVVIDRQRDHGYIPLVHERVCERIDPAATSLATSAVVEAIAGVAFVHDEVVGFDPATKTVSLASGGTVAGRFIVVALGSSLIPPPSLPGAEHLLRNKFDAETDHAREHLRAQLSESGSKSPRVVVVGGGISGVELAGELAHLRVQRPSGWTAPAVTLVTGGATLLPELSPAIGRRATRALTEQGVELRLSTRLSHADADTVQLDHKGTTERVDCAAAFWCGGIAPSPVLSRLGLPLTDDGWLAVGPTLQCIVTPTPTEPDIFACGDAVRVQGANGQWPTMQRAIECLWQAKVVARNIVRLAAEPPEYPHGVPSLRPHVLRPRFAYGVSLGAQALVVYGRFYVGLSALNIWFRRWLMRQYFARYRGG